MVHCLKPIVLYFGGGFPQVDLILFFQSKGLKVVLVDMEPTCSAASVADLYYQLSILDHEEIIKRIKVDLDLTKIIACYGCGDYAFHTIQKINSLLKFNNGFDFTVFTNKSKTIEKLKEHDIKTPNTFYNGDNLDAAFEVVSEKLLDSENVVIKMINLNNSFGVKVINRNDKSVLDFIKSDFKKFGDAGVRVEEFISGIHINVDGIFLPNGKFMPLSITHRVFIDRNIPAAAWQISNEDVLDLPILAKLCSKIENVFTGYCGPITIDGILSHENFNVIEISPHFHCIKLNLVNNKQKNLNIWVDSLNGITNLESFKPDEVNDQISFYVYSEQPFAGDYLDKLKVKYPNMGLEKMNIRHPGKFKCVIFGKTNSKHDFFDILKSNTGLNFQDEFKNNLSQGIQL